MTPAELAGALAAGWGGRASRDADVARAARARVLAEAPPAVRAQLEALGLVRAPRLLTAARLLAFARRLGAEPGVDGAVLEAALLDLGESGGEVSMLALASSRAEAYLRSRIRDGVLALRNLGLTELPPIALPEMVQLDVTANRLRTVPPLPHVTALKLSENPIAALPALPAVAALHLARAGLAAAPPSLWSLAGLRALSLADNELTAVPDPIAGLTALHTLWLSGNPLRVLPPIVAQLPALRRLHVAHAGLTALPPALFAATHLVELKLTGNPLPPATLAALREALPGCAIR